MDPTTDFDLKENTRRATRMAIALVSIALVLTVSHWHVRSLPPSLATPLILLDHLFNLGLLSIVLMACWSLGLRILRLLGCAGIDPLSGALLAVPLGLGILAYGALALGLVGLFRPLPIMAFTGCLLASSVGDGLSLVSQLRLAVREGNTRFARLRHPERLLILLGVPGFAMALTIALAPPTDYDGLMYHLTAPRWFLQAGRIYPISELDGANFPFTAEMIYSVGLAFGTDSFGRLVNVALWSLMVLGTWWIGRRYVGERSGLMAALVLLTVPSAYLASSTSVEVLMAALVVAATIALFRFLEQGGTGWVILMGIYSGLIMGTKLLAVALPVTLAIGLAVHHLTGRDPSLGRAVRHLSILAVASVAVASPWYLKNWLWMGAPLYPVFADGTASYLAHVHDVGNPKTLLGFASLPLSIFFPPDEWTFSMGLPSYFFLSYLFLSLPLVLFARRNRYLYYLSLMVALFFATWAPGFQLVRFLFPAYSALSLLVGHGLVEGGFRGRRLPASWITCMLGVFLGISMALQMVVPIGIRPIGVLLGIESPDSFLSNAVTLHSGTRWANEHLPAGSKLFLIGTGQGYYFHYPVRLDQSADNLPKLFSLHPTPVRAAEALHVEGFTHILVNDAEMQWHLAHRYPGGELKLAIDQLERLLGDHASLLYRDRSVRVYGLLDPSAAPPGTGP